MTSRGLNQGGPLPYAPPPKISSISDYKHRAQDDIDRAAAKLSRAERISGIACAIIVTGTFALVMFCVMADWDRILDAVRAAHP